MEIILALMALAATPFGAALLDGPTRKRAGKILRANKNAKKPVQVGGALEKRNKDWTADLALADMWQDCFDWLSIQDRDEWYDRVVAFAEDSNKKVKALNVSLREVQKDYNDLFENYYYSEYTAREQEILRKEDARLRKAKEKTKALPSDMLKEGEVIMGLIKKYGDRFHKNDLLAAISQPRFDQRSIMM